MVGGEGPEKIVKRKRAGFKEGEVSSGKKKVGVKRGGVRKMPHASDESVSFEASLEETSSAGSEEKMSVEGFKEKYGAWLDKDLFNKDGDLIRIVSKYYDVATGKVGAWFNIRDKKPERRMIAIGELNQYFEEFKPREAKRKKIDHKISINAETERTEPFNGQFLEDEFEMNSKTFMPGVYHNGSSPHDAEEASKERSKGGYNQEAEKELLGADQMEIFVKWNGELQGNLKGTYASFDYSQEEEDAMLLLDVRRFLKSELIKSGLAPSEEQAKKMVEQVIAKSLVV